MIDKMRVAPGEHAHLDRRAADDDLGLDSKEAAATELVDLTAKLTDLQSRLWAENHRAVLVVLQGLDAAGKDGTIAHVFGGVNPQGCSARSFGRPTEPELDHDYLWRAHLAVPGRGEIGIFNRSHYEDVLVVRVLGLVPEDRWRKRFGHIRAFEEMLRDEGTTIIKIHLQVSKDEQRQRLQARLDDPTKNWKFRTDDLAVREQWDAYQQAYEEMITETSTEAAPWFVVPADRKWVRNVAVSRLLVHHLEEMNPQYPPADPALAKVVVS